MESSDRLPRKLAAILYPDVAGYSRLTGEDEDATHRRLREYLDLVATTVEHNRGRVAHYAGDAVLAMFDAAVDALSCAAHIQRDLGTRSEALPNERKVQFRIGINLGDVIEDRGDIYGDGVNVAARLEGSVQRFGDRVRITVQLADTATGHQVWSDRVDRTVDDVFGLETTMNRAANGPFISGGTWRRTVFACYPRP